MINQNNKYDVAIVGAGLVGSIQALLLAQNDFNVLLLDLYPEPSFKYFTDNHSNAGLNLDLKPDLRMSAITLKSQEILESIGAWEGIKSRRGLMEKTYVWEEEGPGDIYFDSLSIGKNYLSSIVENNLLLENITLKIKNNKNITVVRPCKIQNINFANNVSEVTLYIVDTLQKFYVNLVIGADGANSWVRDYYNYNLEINSYNHTALVTNIYTKNPHNNIAHQKFLKEGVLAFLPWYDKNCCSIVWSQSKESAEFYQNCDIDEFNAKLEKIFNNKLGKIINTDKRVIFPLIKRHVDQYYKIGSVLIGDAAHTIHPLAGQGLNLGIYDAYELSLILSQAKQKNYNIASDYILKKYQLKRRGHNQQMLDLMDLFKYIYSHDSKAIGLIRNLGVNLSNNIGLIKKQMARYAAGY